MTIRTLSGQDIDHALTNAMVATLHALRDEGILSTEIAGGWANSHVCMLVNTDDGLWYRIKTWIGMADEKGISIPVIFKVSTKKETVNESNS